MPVAMALLRDVQNLCPKEVLNFILDLIKYNDNRKNKVTHVLLSLGVSEIRRRLNPLGFSSSLLLCCFHSSLTTTTGLS